MPTRQRSLANTCQKQNHHNRQYSIQHRRKRQCKYYQHPRYRPTLYQRSKRRQRRRRPIILQLCPTTNVHPISQLFHKQSPRPGMQRKPTKQRRRPTYLWTICRRHSSQCQTQKIYSQGNTRLRRRRLLRILQRRRRRRIKRQQRKRKQKQEKEKGRRGSCRSSRSRQSRKQQRRQQRQCSQ